MDKSTNKRWVVMGVSGAGKSEIGARLAAALGVRFLEGDSFHSPHNVAKMSAGVPLGDEDRADWLLALSQEIGAAEEHGVIAEQQPHTVQEK